MSEYITVNVEATIRLRVLTKISVPKAIMDAVPADDMWDDTLEKYIQERIDLFDDGRTSLDFDPRDVDLEDVEVSP